jgi:acetyltransferase-like isoleucine patch superfamily enzyme
VEGRYIREENVVIRDGAKIGDNVVLKCGSVVGTNVEIGEHTYIGPGATLLHMGHQLSGLSEPCKIGKMCFIGAGAIVLPGIEICNGTVIGAGAVVTKSIESPAKYKGNPAEPSRFHYVGKYTIIDEGTVIHHNAWIGNHVHVRPYVSIGNESEIRDYCFLAEGCRIGENTRIFQYSNIGGGTVIGNNCFIGPRVTTTNDKEISYPNTIWEKKPPIIEDNVRIGACAVILPGVIVREGSRIGAGAVVTRSTKPGLTYKGNPAV